MELHNLFGMVRNRSLVLDNNDKDIDVFYKLRPKIDSVVMYRCGSVWSSIAIHNRTQGGCHPEPGKAYGYRLLSSKIPMRLRKA